MPHEIHHRNSFFVHKTKTKQTKKTTTTIMNGITNVIQFLSDGDERDADKEK